jgi:hypothetical protein
MSSQMQWENSDWLRVNPGMPEVLTLDAECFKNESDYRIHRILFFQPALLFLLAHAVQQQCLTLPVSNIEYSELLEICSHTQLYIR